ncbi:MAG TPA: EF-P beta-lysylation protein EpmB [Crenotrichaceae bacterium]|nr:EF-P beta-lysylation protein EpmB [Crenotrichaceae bacterium]
MTNSTPASWQQELAHAFTQPEDLLKFLQLDNNASHLYNDLEKAVQDFSFLVPVSYAQRMQKGDPEDPLLLQVMPSAQELIPTPGYSTNPVGDLEATTIPGLLHKYYGRVLLITTGSCPIHCRYCFRRNFPYQHNQTSSKQHQHAIDYIRLNHEITEVILSGGDPLMLSNQRLSKLFQSLQAISHLKRLRIHTRIPTVLPSRIDDDLLQLFTQTRLKIILVTHINHANELDSKTVLEVFNQLSNAKIRLLNQSVLLHRINDSPHTLIKLSEALFDAGIIPYYLHLLDKTTGTSHFEITDHNALTLYQSLQNQLPGYLVPKLVREIQGEQSKTLKTQR